MNVKKLSERKKSDLITRGRKKRIEKLMNKKRCIKKGVYIHTTYTYLHFGRSV